MPTFTEKIRYRSRQIGDVEVFYREAGPVDALAALSVRLGEGAAENFMMACARAPVAMAGLPTEREAVRTRIRRALGVPDGDVEESICDACEALDTGRLEALIAANRGWGTATGLAQAEIGDERQIGRLDGRWAGFGGPSEPALSEH